MRKQNEKCKHVKKVNKMRNLKTGKKGNNCKKGKRVVKHVTSYKTVEGNKRQTMSKGKQG